MQAFFRDRLVVWTLAAVCGALWLVGATLSVVLPYEPDLYRLLYDHVGPRRQEGTAVFLLAFPGFVTAGVVIGWWQARWPVANFDSRDAACLWMALAFFAVFVVGAVYRFSVVIHHYF